MRLTEKDILCMIHFPWTLNNISHINVQATSLHYFTALISFFCWSPPCSDIHPVTQNTPCLRKPCCMDTRIMHRLPFRLFRPTFNRRCRSRRKMHSFTWCSYPFLGRFIWGGETQGGERCPKYAFITVRGWDNCGPFISYHLSANTCRTGIAAGSPIPIDLMKNLIEKMNLRDLTNAYGMSRFRFSVAYSLSFLY